MKKAFKIIIPILLALVIIGSIAWYLLAYDTGFTQDLLLNQARRFEESGKHAAAVWVYNLAYSHSGEDDNVAIELANQYKGIGNYTKAEYTLSKAIADSGSTELYLELCKTYVEQDKLLDAVRMLDSIADPAIKAELDALRPAAPTLEPAPGFFNEYVKLDISWDDGTLYVTTDGEYPSTENQPYSEVITLPAGETTVYALAVADNGLVSPVTIGTYTVVGVIEPVIFQDTAIEAQVRQMLNFSSETVVYTSDLWTIDEFTVPQDAATYADLAGMINLKELTIPEAKTSDFSFLSSLQSLESFEVSGIILGADTLSMIATPVSLKYLSLTDCGISSIAPLASLKNLVALNLNNNSIRDLSPLANMQMLEELYMQYNAVNDLGVVSSLPALKILDLSYNSLTSVATIGNCVSLEQVDLTHNKLTDIASVGNLKDLTHLAVAENALTDISSLASCTELKDLDISDNTISDIDPLSNLTGLMYLNFSNNKVEELPRWPVDCALISIDGSHNMISSVEELRDLYHLNLVNLDYNADIESIDALESCPALVQVDVYGTQVTDITALTERSIIVHYDPTVNAPEEYGEDEE